MLPSLVEIVTSAIRRSMLESMDMMLPSSPLAFVVWEEPDIDKLGSSLQILNVLMVKSLKFNIPTPFTLLYRVKIEFSVFPHREHSSCGR